MGVGKCRIKVLIFYINFIIRITIIFTAGNMDKNGMMEDACLTNKIVLTIFKVLRNI